VSLGRKLAIVALLYVIEGFPMGVYVDVWPVALRRYGIDLTQIGLFTGLYMAWSVKFFWSPFIDRYGERRQWIAACLTVMAACLVGVAASDLHQLGIALWLLFGVYCVASATQDIAIDAYAIGVTDRGEEGPVNSMKFMAYRVGLLISGSGLLFLPRWIDWSATFVVAAGLSLAMACLVFTAPRVAVPVESRRGTLAPLLRWLNRPHVYSVLAFILFFRVCDRAMGAMVTTFWVDRGFADEEIGAIKGLVGVAAGLAGALVGGGLVARLGIGRSLWLTGVLAVASNLVYAAAAAFPESGRAGVYGASIIESFCSGLVGVAFLSYLMRICQKEHAAVQYALVTGLYALAGTLISMPSGWLTEHLGYARYFALTVLYAVPAFVFLPRARTWIGRE
jgi:PAT family beta-lactamase induction signal transducer AmpG